MQIWWLEGTSKSTEKSSDIAQLLTINPFAELAILQYFAIIFYDVCTMSFAQRWKSVNKKVLNAPADQKGILK